MSKTSKDFEDALTLYLIVHKLYSNFHSSGIVILNVLKVHEENICKRIPNYENIKKCRPLTTMRLFIQVSKLM